MDPAELEREIDRALGRLPPPRAPRTLAPRVMQAIAAAAPASAVARAGWRSWPLAWQMLTLVVACSLAVAIALAVPLASMWIGNATAARAAAATWQIFFAPVVTPAIALMAVMCTATALLVAGLKHVAWEGQWTPLS